MDAERLKEKKFWDNVIKRGDDECWEWSGYRNWNGYGVLYYNYKGIRAHRYSYELHKGKIPDGLFVCHSCDNPPCVNPKHLWVGTNRDNILDSYEKGISPSGELHFNSKLKSEDIIIIRKLFSAGLIRVDIAKIFGVCRSNIELILNGKAWKRVV